MYWTMLDICSRLSLFWWLRFVYFVVVYLCLVAVFSCEFWFGFMRDLLLFWVLVGVCVYFCYFVGCGFYLILIGWFTVLLPLLLCV